jgi:hypothetical protein
MTQRDRYLLVIVGVLGAVAAFWFLALSPKMKTLDTAKQDLAKAEASLEQSRGQATQYAQARLQYPTAYAQVARLGKAVPSNTDETSLVYQLEKAADRAGVDFTNLVLDSTEGGAAAASAPAPAPAPAPAAESGAAPAAAGATATAGTGAGGDEVIGSVPADATLTAAVPSGSSTGAANLRVMHFTLDYEGSFFRLEDFLREIKRMTWSNRKNLTIGGRLVTIDAIDLDEGGEHVKLSATTYLLPAGQGLFAGATPTGPAQDGTQAAAAPAAPETQSTPPAATVGAVR